MYLIRPCLAVVLGLALPCATVHRAFAQLAILQMQVVEGEAAVHMPGSRSTRPITVEVTDETGKPVLNAAVSFHTPEEGPGGTFTNGLRTAVATTDARGRASVYGLQVNRNPERFQLRIVASKEQARAGIVSFQYIAEPVGATPPAAPAVRVADRDAAAVPTKPAPVGRTRSKWLTILVLVGGGTAAGALAAGRASGSESAPPAVVSPPVLSIGTPSISVGKP